MFNNDEGRENFNKAMLSIMTPIYLIHPIITVLTHLQIKAIRNGTFGPWELILIVYGNKIEFGYFDKEPNIKIIYFRERLSIARAFNLGFKQANGDIICPMHNDVIVPPGWNPLLEKVAHEGKMAFPMVREDDICKKRGIKPAFPTQVPSCCYMLSRETWNQLDGYDEDFEEIHWEDTDLFCRAQKLDIPFVRCNITVKHERGATRCFNREEGNEWFHKNYRLWCKKHDIPLMGHKGIIPLPRISEKPEVFD